jgi:flagellar protein FlaG
MIVNAVSELPAIIINNIYELSNEVDKNKKSEIPVSDSRQNLSLKKESDEFVIKSDKNDKKQINYNELAKKLQNMLKNNDLSIEFTMDKDINKMIMKLVDENTDETIKQFPPEIAIKIAKIVASTLGNGQLTDAKI